MDNKLCLGGPPCVLTSLESGAGLCLAESEVEIHPSTTCCEPLFTGFTGGLTLVRKREKKVGVGGFEVSGSRQQRGKKTKKKTKPQCAKWPLAIPRGRKSSQEWTRTSSGGHRQDLGSHQPGSTSLDSISNHSMSKFPSSLNMLCLFLQPYSGGSGAELL